MTGQRKPNRIKRLHWSRKICAGNRREFRRPKDAAAAAPTTKGCGYPSRWMTRCRVRRCGDGGARAEGATFGRVATDAIPVPPVAPVRGSLASNAGRPGWRKRDDTQGGRWQHRPPILVPGWRRPGRSLTPQVEGHPGLDPGPSFSSPERARNAQQVVGVPHGRRNLAKRREVETKSRGSAVNCDATAATAIAVCTAPDTPIIAGHDISKSTGSKSL